MQFVHLEPPEPPYRVASSNQKARFNSCCLSRRLVPLFKRVYSLLLMGERHHHHSRRASEAWQSLSVWMSTHERKSLFSLRSSEPLKNQRVGWIFFWSFSACLRQTFHRRPLPQPGVNTEPDPPWPWPWNQVRISTKSPRLSYKPRDK